MAASPERPTCRLCGTPLILRGKRARQLKTQGGQQITLDRSYGLCPTGKKGLFPLDEGLALVPAQLTPLLQDQLSHLSTWMPFAHAARWIQGFIDFYCRDATRILDFPHTAQRICQIGEAVLGADHASLRAWRTRQLHRLKHDGPEGVLDSLRSFAGAQLNLPLIAENLLYLEKRVAQMQYGDFQAQGWPIGSGMVESANKLVDADHPWRRKNRATKAELAAGCSQAKL